MAEPNLLPGMLSRDELADLVARGEIETVLTAFPDLYGRLVGKRIVARHFVEHIAAEGMHACDYLLACDMEMDPVPGYRFTSWETGYGDFRCRPDFATLRRCAWHPQTALVLCDLETDPGMKPVDIAPRRILQRQLLRASERGFSVMAGCELEMYVFDETYESARAKHYHDLKTWGCYVEDYHLLEGAQKESLIGAIRRALDASGVPVEFSKGEWGPGQQEINLRFSEALTQCDRAVLHKHAAKEIAIAQGKAVTFMAKWDQRLAGSSMHVHMSLWNPSGDSNLFDGEQPVGGVCASDTFRWFLGGWLRRARELAACFAPYVASYKRYQSGSFAPTGIAWSVDNRTAGLRVVGGGQSLRIECRLPGADANPYVAVAALIAAGLEGIDNRLEPPAAFTGDVYKAPDLQRVPMNLRDAIVELERSDFARTAFGEEVVTHYLHFLRTEQRKFDEVVTCWERARFFERV